MFQTQPFSLEHCHCSQVSLSPVDFWFLDHQVIPVQP